MTTNTPHDDPPAGDGTPGTHAEPAGGQRVSYVHPPLVAAALETERFVASTGWDQPPRLFALVRTAGLLAAEPSLAASLGLDVDDTDPATSDRLSSVEQDGLPESDGIEDLLAQLAWPPEVDGVALAVERIVVPPSAEEGLPEDPAAAAEVLAAHPERADVRLLVAVLRDGDATCLLRQRAHDSDDQVAVGRDIAPGLVEALLATLQD